MVTTETLLPFWTTFFAVVGCFFGVRAALRRKRERKKLEEQRRIQASASQATGSKIDNSKTGDPENNE